MPELVVASPLLVGHENDWLEAHPIDDHITLANAYFVIFLSFLTQEIVPGFWIYTAATPLTLLELWGRCGHPKTTIVLLLSSISENIICVGKSTGLWSLWIFFSQRKQERFQCWGYEVSKVMQHVWKDAFPGRTDQKGGSAVNLTHPMCEIDFISIKVSFHGFVISIQ